MPCGGVPVAHEIAHALEAPLDIFVVRKLGVPGHEEFAMGAIASGGVRINNPLRGVDVSPEQSSPESRSSLPAGNSSTGTAALPSESGTKQ